ncbi:MAG: tryptophan synthase subunit beta [Gammaproteobacteria bacterium]
MKAGYFGDFGGCFAPETLMRSLHELTESYEHFLKCADFQAELSDYLRDFVGRPTPLTFAKSMTEKCHGARIYLKREDLAHTGAHKINNAIGQALLAKKMGKTHIIAETGAGQHGVATATVCALLNLNCTIYMGTVDIKRQELNVKRMQLLGANVKAVERGSCTLKDATSEAMRDWVTNVNSYYLIGSALGPNPYPTIVRDFQKIIGVETRQQILSITNRLPDELVACVGGGSNAIGLFHAFFNDQAVKMTGVEAGGLGVDTMQHAARFATGRVGVFQGSKTVLLQDEFGQVLDTHSISAGLDYPGVGPEHCFLREMGRVQYTFATDQEALNAAYDVARMEGILPALESAHALAYALKRAPQMSRDEIMIVNVSGRGDKDVETLSQVLS